MKPIFNRVKQGGVISPLLFTIYIDQLFQRLKQLGLGCHVGLTYAGAFCYTDNIALVATSICCLIEMVNICEQFAYEYHISFNPSKSKIQLCPKYEGQLNSMAEPIPHVIATSDALDHDYHHYSAADRQAETDSLILRYADAFSHRF